LEDTNAVELYSEIARIKAEHDAITAKAESVKEKLDALKEKAVSSMPHARVRCAGVELIKSVRRGSVDYEKIPAFQTIDLEQYRKKEVVSYVLKLSNGSEHQ
jgi:hypothetical protein